MVSAIRAVACVLTLASALGLNFQTEDSKLRGAASGSGAKANKSAIVPELHPKSDKVFQMDYPADTRPRGGNVFQYPAPIVQESDEYDRDYPKDENSDSGEWKAQYDYDLIRGRIAKARDAANMASREEFEQEAKNKALARAAAEAEAAAKASEEELEEAKRQLAAAKAARDKLLKEAAANDSDVKAAVDEVDKKLAKLEECKKALADAQARLKALMEEEEQKEKDAAEKAAAEQASGKEEAEKELKNVTTSLEEAEALEAAAKKRKAELEAQMKYKKEAFEEASKDYAASAEEVAKWEKELEAAEEELRKFRHKQAGTDGGIYVKPKVGAYDPCAGCPGYKRAKQDGFKVPSISEHFPGASSGGDHATGARIAPDGKAYSEDEFVKKFGSAEWDKAEASSGGDHASSGGEDGTWWPGSQASSGGDHAEESCDTEKCEASVKAESEAAQGGSEAAQGAGIPGLNSAATRAGASVRACGIIVSLLAVLVV